MDPIINRHKYFLFLVSVPSCGTNVQLSRGRGEARLMCRRFQRDAAGFPCNRHGRGRRFWEVAGRAVVHPLPVASPAMATDCDWPDGGAARARGQWPRPVARHITGSEGVRAATPTPTAPFCLWQRTDPFSPIQMCRLMVAPVRLTPSLS